MVQIKKTTLIAAYLIFTAFVVGQASMYNQYACPGEGPVKTAGFATLAAVIWPVAITISMVGGGYTTPPNCLDGTVAKRPR